METYTRIWETSVLRDKIKDNIQHVDVFSRLVVPVKRDYKAVLEFHVGVLYSRLGIFKCYNRQVPSSVYDSLNSVLCIAHYIASSRRVISE
jgi:hypothetical protein